MKICSDNKQYTYNKHNFTARNPEIKFADDIARRVNQCYPRISPSNIDDLHYAIKFSEFSDKLWYQIRSMRNQIRSSFKNLSGVEERAKFVTDKIKERKLGNCGESTTLAEIAARTNGIEDCLSATLFQEKRWEEFDLDHQVLLVRNKNKPYIIDSWLGFADYVPNALKRYQNEFSHHFDFRPVNKLKIFFRPYPAVGSEIFSQKYSQDELKNLYPELVLKSK